MSCPSGKLNLSLAQKLHKTRECQTRLAERPVSPLSPQFFISLEFTKICKYEVCVKHRAGGAKKGLKYDVRTCQLQTLR